jgi:CHAD domain-containing protein
MLYHEPGTRLGEDIEELHDMRVATRRMRAAFRVFRNYYHPKVIQPYQKGLKQTGRALGAVRDLDVFRAEIQAHLDTLPESQQNSLDNLLASLQERRQAARQQMIAYLDSEEYRRFVEQFGEFVETEGLGSTAIDPDRNRPDPYRVRHVAPVAVYRRLAAVRAYDEWVAIPDPPLKRLHRLRIACKRLRYTLEFFREVLGPGTKAVVKQIVVIQDHLGALQDAVVASDILCIYLKYGTWGHKPTDETPTDAEVSVEDPGVEAYLEAKGAEMQHLLETFPEVWQKLQGAEFSRMVARVVAVL